MDINVILTGLAMERWGELRKQYNRAFMGMGPGAEWDRYKASPATTRLFQEDAALSAYIGKDPLVQPVGVAA